MWRVIDRPIDARVRLRASGDVIPRHGEVTRGETRIIDPAAKLIARAWSLAHGGTAIPRLTHDYDQLRRDLQRARAAGDAAAAAVLEQRIRHHECPTTFCPAYDPVTASRIDHEDAAELCQVLPPDPARPGVARYVPAVMPWQKAIGEYVWGSRRSLLLAAQTGLGKTVVAAYALQLMQLIDTEQGGFLGLGPEDTNIAVIVATKDLAGSGGARGWREKARSGAGTGAARRVPRGNSHRAAAGC